MAHNIVLLNKGTDAAASSAKSGLGTAVSRDSRVWFTPGRGILNEVCYPRIDHAYTRDPYRDGWADVLLGEKAGYVRA
jgi:hypothetical protein